MYKQDLHHWHLLSLPHHHDQIYISSQPDDGAGWCKEEAEPTIDELPPPTFKGAGSFHIHRKTIKELGTLAVLGVREQPNLAQNLVTHRH